MDEYQNNNGVCVCVCVHVHVLSPFYVHDSWFEN